jgi:hypothetical protein
MNPRFNFAPNVVISAGIVMLLPWLSHAAQFIEVHADIEVTSWSSEKIRSRTPYTTQFIVGTNLWFFEGNFLGHATRRFWFTGTNLVEETIITSRSAERQNIGSPIAITQEIGERSVRIHTPYSTGIHDVAYVSWMAFCSGTFLKSAGREIILPFHVRESLPRLSDKTAVFEDGFRLPRQFELYGPHQQKLCEYTVQESTNVLGWNLPLSFKLVQYREDNIQGKIQAVGNVSLIRSSRAPVLPTRVLEPTR